MKKILAALLLTTGLLTTEANASLLFVGAMESTTRDQVICTALLGTMVTVPAGLVLGGAALLTGNASLAKVSIGLIVLDEKNHQTVASELSKRYPFIDDQSVIDELASSLEIVKTESDFTLSKVNEEKTRSILSKTDLSDEEVEAVVSDLK